MKTLLTLAALIFIAGTFYANGVAFITALALSILITAVIYAIGRST